VSINRAQGQSLAVAAVGTGFNLYDFVFSHKAATVVVSTQSKNKVQNSHALSYMSCNAL